MTTKRPGVADPAGLHWDTEPDGGKAKASASRPRVERLASIDVGPSPSWPVEYHYRRQGRLVSDRDERQWWCRFDRLELCSIDGLEPVAPVKPVRLTSLRTVARGFLEGWRQAVAERAPAAETTGPFFDARRLYPNNLSHVLWEIAPLVLWAQRAIGQSVTLVTHQMELPYRRLFDALNIPVIDTRGKVRGTGLDWHACRPFTALGWPWLDMTPMIFEPSLYHGFRFDCKAGSENLFVSRRGARAPLNASAVDHLLARYGYQTVFIEDYEGADKLGILSQAKRLVVMHGAGLTPAAFNASGFDSVIELMPSHAVNFYFHSVLAPSTHHWSMVMSRYDPRESRLGWPALLEHKNAPFEVDLEALEAALDSSHRSGLTARAA